MFSRSDEIICYEQVQLLITNVVLHLYRKVVAVYLSIHFYRMSNYNIIIMCKEEYGEHDREARFIRIPVFSSNSSVIEKY